MCDAVRSFDRTPETFVGGREIRIKKQEGRALGPSCTWLAMIGSVDYGTGVNSTSTPLVSAPLLTVTPETSASSNPVAENSTR